MSGLINSEDEQIIKKANSNYLWFVNNYEYLNKSYKDKFIAIDNKVIDYDSEQPKLLSRLRKKYGNNTNHIFFTYIGEKDNLTFI